MELPPEPPSRLTDAAQHRQAGRHMGRHDDAEEAMFRRKSGDQEEEARGQEGEEYRPAGGVADTPRRGVPSKTVVFHPDVPRAGAPDLVPADSPGRTESDPKRLTVGRETTITGGTIVDCERLTVEGIVDAALPDGRVLEIVKGGIFKGTATVDNADIAGTFEGELKVNKRLYIRASGRVLGTVRYGQFEVERGGRIEGSAAYDPADREADLQPVALPPAGDDSAAPQEDEAPVGARPGAV
jgi:cytoskeletal protein CcmA (bactofilin family)